MWIGRHNRHDADYVIELRQILNSAFVMSGKWNQEVNMKFPIHVLKQTDDNWGPSFKVEGAHLKFVEVSLLKGPHKSGFRVCAWGDDDYGLEKDFTYAERGHAVQHFIQIISLEKVNVDILKKMGFRQA
jgi:hypothetical protein